MKIHGPHQPAPVNTEAPAFTQTVKAYVERLFSRSTRQFSAAETVPTQRGTSAIQARMPWSLAPKRSALWLNAGALDLPRRSLEGLPAGSVVTAPAQLKAAMIAALDVPVTGTHTAREYIDAFTKRGYEAFLVGGCVRDVAQKLRENPNASADELKALLNDVDIVTNAPPSVARQICEEIAPEFKDGGVWSPRAIERFGFVLAGGKKAGTGGNGIDIAAMKQDLIADSKGRDFTCNALYYDPVNHVVVDPLGRGIADAENHLLHVARDKQDLMIEHTLSLRFFKFRLRGWQADGETRALILQHAGRFFKPRDPREVFALTSGLGRVAPKDASTPEKVTAWLRGLEQIMDQDGAGQLMRGTIRGSTRDQVYQQVLKRNGEH